MLFRRELICQAMLFVGLCAGSENSETSESESESEGVCKVLTYNAALLEASIAPNDPSIENNREQRLDALTDYLNQQSDADIVCLQEIFYAQDAEKIINGVSSKFPYSFSALHSNGTLPQQSTQIWEPSCNEAVFNGFITCSFDNNCISPDDETIVDVAAYLCLINKCFNEFLGLISLSGENCLSCLITNSPSKYISRCGGAPSLDKWNMNNMGLLLLSRKELSYTTAVDFFPFVPNILVRGYLQVKAGDNLYVRCTHLVPTTFNFPPLNPDFNTFSEQQTAEIQLLVDALPNFEPLVVLGDFNCGPASVLLDPLEPSNYNNLTANFATKLVKKGTFTSTNSYNEGQGDFNFAIDHVFTNGEAKILNSKIVLKNDKKLPGPRKLPLSDHYGVRALIKLMI